MLEAGSSTLRQLTELHDCGVGISIDDFGTGYASLRYLVTLPVSSVKVDRSLTAGLPTDATSVMIVRAVATLAADLGLACIIEGIETEETEHVRLLERGPESGRQAAAMSGVAGTSCFLA